MCHESKPERQLLVAARKPRPDKMLEEEKKQKKQKKHNSIAFRHFGLQKHTARADTCHKDSRSIQSAPTYCNRQVGGELHILTLAKYDEHR